MKQHIKSGFLFGVTASVTMILAGVVYAAWNDDVVTGNPLTAQKWNDLVTQVESLSTNTSNIPSGAVMAFNLASCPTGWSNADGTNGIQI